MKSLIVTAAVSATLAASAVLAITTAQGTSKAAHDPCKILMTDIDADQFPKRFKTLVRIDKYGRERPYVVEDMALSRMWLRYPHLLSKHVGKPALQRFIKMSFAEREQKMFPKNSPFVMCYRCLEKQRDQAVQLLRY